MKTYRDLMNEYSGAIKEAHEKVSFVPNPDLMAQQAAQHSGQQPDQSQGQPQPGGTPDPSQALQDSSQAQGQPGQDPSQMQGDPSQAQPGQDPSQQIPQDPRAGMSGTPEDIAELKNTKVNLSVESLLDLMSGGKASQSRLKTEQMKEKHEQKRQMDQQKQQQAEQEAQQQAQMAQQQGQGPMGGGGIYSSGPMDGSNPPAPSPAQPAAPAAPQGQPGMGM
jgi:type II secretory pathway pseudopilin PulG